MSSGNEVPSSKKTPKKLPKLCVKRTPSRQTDKQTSNRTPRGRPKLKTAGMSEKLAKITKFFEPTPPKKIFLTEKMTKIHPEILSVPVRLEAKIMARFEIIIKILMKFCRK